VNSSRAVGLRVHMQKSCLGNSVSSLASLTPRPSLTSRGSKSRTHTPLIHTAIKGYPAWSGTVLSACTIASKILGRIAGLCYFTSILAGEGVCPVRDLCGLKSEPGSRALLVSYFQLGPAINNFRPASVRCVHCAPSSPSPSH